MRPIVCFTPGAPRGTQGRHEGFLESLQMSEQQQGKARRWLRERRRGEKRKQEGRMLQGGKEGAGRG